MLFNVIDYYSYFVVNDDDDGDDDDDDDDGGGDYDDIVHMKRRVSTVRLCNTPHL